MKKNLKLFVFYGILSDWTDGLAFALAETVDEARQMIKNKGLSSASWDELDNTEPKVFTDKMGDFIYGGS